MGPLGSMGSSRSVGVAGVFPLGGIFDWLQGTGLKGAFFKDLSDSFLNTDPRFNAIRIVMFNLLHLCH